MKDLQIILIGEKDPGGRFLHLTDICDLGSSQGHRWSRVVVDTPKSDLSFLVYSSGTTGHPKGVMLSHRNVISNILMLKAGEGVNLSWHRGYNDQGDRILGFLPFYHIYGSYIPPDQLRGYDFNRLQDSPHLFTKHYSTV